MIAISKDANKTDKDQYLSKKAESKSEFEDRIAKEANVADYDIKQSKSRQGYDKFKEELSAKEEFA